MPNENFKQFVLVAGCITLVILASVTYLWNYNISLEHDLQLARISCVNSGGTLIEDTVSHTYSYKLVCKH